MLVRYYKDQVTLREPMKDNEIPFSFWHGLSGVLFFLIANKNERLKKKDQRSKNPKTDDCYAKPEHFNNFV